MTTDPTLTLSCYGPDPVGTTRTFTATSDSGNYVWLYFDGTLVAQGYDQVSYTATGSSPGSHTIEAVASNGCGSVTQVCTWNIADPSCLPAADHINFFFDQFRVRINGVWSEWKSAACNENAIARFGYGSKDKNEFSTNLDNIQWRKEVSSCEYGIVSFRDPSGPNQKLYLVSSSRNGHAMVAEYSGRDDTQEHFEADRQLWVNWRFFQFDQENIQPAQYISPSDPQMPYGAPFNFITIRRVTSINFTPGGSPKYDGTTIAQFTINGNGLKEWNYPFAE
ncbi:MAG: hypothetical protein Q7T80_05725 [Methanoregula sp.]|nr:hypothetical protein [Methanoregula sp.]